MSRWTAVALVVSSTAALAEDPCVKVTQRVLKDRLELTAELNNCLEVTITVTATLTNVANALPDTVDSRGRKRFLLASWRQVDRDERWKVSDWKYRWKLGRRLSRVPPPLVWKFPFEGSFRLLQGPLGTFSHGPGSQSEQAWDWAMPEGTPVLAARDGVVVGVRDDCAVGGPDPALKDDNNYVVLMHDDGTFSEYNHLLRDGVRVAPGDAVKAGQRIGLSGHTGFSSEPHLHFSVFRTIDGSTRESLPSSFEGLPGVPDIVEPRATKRRRSTDQAVQDAVDAINALDP